MAITEVKLPSWLHKTGQNFPPPRDVRQPWDRANSGVNAIKLRVDIIGILYQRGEVIAIGGDVPRDPLLRAEFKQLLAKRNWIRAAFDIELPSRVIPI